MTVELSGGLGNVMFQLAAAYAMSRRYDKDVAVTPHPLLKVFEQHPAEDTAPKSLVAQEEDFRFNWSQWDDVAGISDVLLRGYFQSSQYWEKTTTKHLLAFREEHHKVVDKYRSDKPFVGIHIRRGDYVNNPNYHNLPIAYYLGALYKFFPDFEKDNTLLIFSDDLPWCKIQFQCFDNVVYVDEPPVETMIMMTVCEGLILSNSTFSWWGAFLSNARRVVYPTKYFSGDLAHLSTATFWEERWSPFSHNHKFNLNDVTFVIPTTYDQPAREENLTATVRVLREHFQTNILIGENNSSRFSYIDAEVVPFHYRHFHRTRIINRLVALSRTKYFVNWDADVFVPVAQILKMVNSLREGSDMVIPYDGTFHNISREHYPDIVANRDVAAIGEYELVSAVQGSVGGAIGFRKRSFVRGGGENERFVSYGPEDKERWYRFSTLGFKTDRIKGTLYHLDHKRTPNSSTAHKHFLANNKEWRKVQGMDKESLTEYINGNSS